MISDDILGRPLTEDELVRVEKTIHESMAEHIFYCIQATIDFDMWLEKKFDKTDDPTS